MSDVFSFALQAQRQRARAGSITTPHGQIKTPIFMPVGTRASVRALDSTDVENLQAQIILGNTYHLYLRPGEELLRAHGGLHQFMHWQRPILTDSGGYQVFSLGAQQKHKGRSSSVAISETGVEFSSHLDGSKHQITPERAIEIQRVLGSDIMMAFDECLPDSDTPERMAESVARTTRWAARCKETWEEHARMSEYGRYQALFGIVQGSTDLELRKKSLTDLMSIGFDGYALGGETVGYDLEGTKAVMNELEPLFPKEAPRYAMGMGRDPQDIIEAVVLGFDMFDCVGPTRLARNGALFHGQLAFAEDRPYFLSEFDKARLNISNQRFAADLDPILIGCDCCTCTSGYSRSYLHHLYKSGELSFYRLASIHNLRVMVRLVEQLRTWIMDAENQ